jgi:CubicO group peptidase (beta-lactamase class C family)/D-alanyl-D-alanine dipeptidase
MSGDRPSDARHRLRAGAAALAIMLAIPTLGMIRVAPAMAAGQANIEVVTTRISTAAASEVAEKNIPSIAIALVDRSGVIWSGVWNAPGTGQPQATADSVYRAGSVSKLFTDIAIMKLVEQGRLKLDDPVSRYLPDFAPHNPFGVPVTVRQLMTHRSGLIREAPRGHYFDTAAKGQADAVASLNETTLVARPGSITKYSNAGIAVVGEIVSRITGLPYEQAIGQLVLAPLGMSASAFSRNAVKGALARAEMASFDGPRFEAPLLELGTPAAGGLYTTAGDLGLFVQSLLNQGKLVDGARLLHPESLDEMWREQFPTGTGRRFGLGFVLDDVGGQRSVGHTGAVYGYATDVRLLPEAGIGVVVLSTVDSGVTAQRLGRFALAEWQSARAGTPLPDWLRTSAISGEKARTLSGRFVEGGDSVNLRNYDGHLMLDGPEVAAEVREANGKYSLDDAQTFDDKIALAPDGSWVELAGRRYRRADWARPAGPGAELAALIGEYGWGHNILRIYQRDGKPYVRIEWTDWRQLTRIGPDNYAFPSDRGLYPLERLRFERGTDGHVTTAMLGAIRFPRRDFGADAEDAVRAAVASGMGSIRKEALAASPPPEPPSAKPSDLVAIHSVAPAIRFDIRYATANNFMGQKLYEIPGAFMQRPAAEALAQIDRKLAEQGFGLLVHDAYRPWYVTKMFWDATPPQHHMFVADPLRGSRHNRGAAVDLTMFDLKTGVPMITTSRYDEFSSRAYTNYVGGSDEQRWLREVLRGAMESNGFSVYPEEWWHFDRDDWQAYPIGNQTFQQLTAK